MLYMIHDQACMRICCVFLEFKPSS